MSEANVYAVVLTRRADIDHEAFCATWLGEHRRLIDALPKLRRAELLPVADAGAGPDGLGLLYFDSAADLRAALASPAAQELRAHTARFARSDDALRLLLAES